MRISTTLVLLLFLLSGVSSAQQSEHGRVTVTLSDGTRFLFTTLSDRGGAQNFSGGISTTVPEDNRFHRLLMDRNGLIFFGYDIRIEQDAREDSFTLHVLPLSTKGTHELAKLLQNNKQSTGARKTVPTFTEERTIPSLRPGKRATIDVLVDPETGEKIMDVIELTRDKPAPLAGQASAPASSEPVFVFSLPRIMLNGSLLAEPGATSMGKFAVLYIPGKGGYFFSLKQPPRYSFQRTATIENNRLYFTLDGDSFELVCASDILPGVNHAKIWIFHDPRFKPNFPEFLGIPQTDEVTIGVADRVETWLKEPG
jgi:hypothetical protein